MNLVTAQRSSQTALAEVKIQLGKLEDHVEEVDDHLRGVAGRESLDTRVRLLEKEFEMHGVMLRRISDQFTQLHNQSTAHHAELQTSIQEIKQDVSTIKIAKAITEKSEGTKTERFLAWLKFWGPIIALILTGLGGSLLYVADNFERMRGWFKHPTPAETVERLNGTIAAERKGPRAKVVKKKLADIEEEIEGR